MALRFIEGFDLNAANDATTDQYYERKLVGTAGTPITSAPAFITVGNSFSVVSNSWQFFTPTFAADDEWIIHVWLRFSSVASTNQNWSIEIRDSSGIQAQLTITAAGGGASDQSDRYLLNIERGEGAATLATVGPFWAGAWNHVQFKCRIDPVNGSYELKVNDVTEASDAGPVNTAGQGVANADRFRFNMDNGIRNCLMDHLVICDSTGSVNNDFLGDVVVASALPNADGDDTDWNTSSGGTHYLLVNETMPSNNVIGQNDPERVTSETVNDIDRWHMQNLVTTYGIPSGTAVHGISVETCAAMEASGNRDLRPVFKDTGGSTAEGDSFNVSGTTFDVFVQIWEENPATATTWSLTSLDAGQFGVKVQA